MTREIFWLAFNQKWVGSIVLYCLAPLFLLIVCCLRIKQGLVRE